MGLTDTTTNTIHHLIKEFEEQVAIAQTRVQYGASTYSLNSSLCTLKLLNQTIFENFNASDEARNSTYTIFGEELTMNELLVYTKKVCHHLSTIIDSQS